MNIQFLGEAAAALAWRLTGVVCVEKVEDLDETADLWLIANSVEAAFQQKLAQVAKPPLFLLLPAWQSAPMPEPWLQAIAKGLGVSLESLAASQKTGEKR